MYARKELSIVIRCMVAQLRNGVESLARGPINSAVRLSALPRDALVSTPAVYFRWCPARFARLRVLIRQFQQMAYLKGGLV